MSKRHATFKEHKTQRGFRFITAPKYGAEDRPMVAQESSAIGDYDDAMDNPGSSYLWIGDSRPRAHLSREEVQELILYLQQWLSEGCLFRKDVPRE